MGRTLRLLALALSTPPVLWGAAGESRATGPQAADSNTPAAGTGTKIVNRLTISGQTVDSIVFVKDTKARSEIRFADGNMVRVEECGGARILHLNDENRTYFYERTGEGLQSREMASGTGGVVTVVSKTTATGEHKPILGREARHLKTEIRTESGNAACGGNTVLVADGWYVDLQAVPECLTRDIEKMLRDRMQAMGCDAKLHFQISGNALTGYPVLLDMTLREAEAGGKNLLPEGNAVSVHQETTEIRSTPLSDDLFRPPDGYREVDSMQELLRTRSANSQASDEQKQARQRTSAEQAESTAKVPGKIRIGVAYPELDAAGAKISPESVRRQIAGQLQASGLDAVQLESEIKTDALKECQPKQCDYVMLEKISVGRPSGKPAGSGGTGSQRVPGRVPGYEARIEFTLIPMSNPARHLDGDNFYNSIDVKLSVSVAIQQAVKTIKSEIETLK